MPINDRLEQRVLADILVSEYDMQVEAVMRLSPQDFSVSHCRNNFIRISEVLFKERKKVDILAYQQWLSSSLDYYDIDEIIKLQDGNPDDLVSHVKLLKIRNYRNKIMDLYKQTTIEINSAPDLDGIEEAKTKMITGLASLEFASKAEFVKPEEFITQIDYNLTKKNVIEGYSWGIGKLDAITSGIVVPRLIVLGGLKKTGKSRMVINTRERLAEQGIHSVFLSLEMPAYEITKLSLSRHAMIDEFKLRSGALISREEKTKYENAKRTINWDLMQTECASGVNVNQVIMKLRRYSKQYPNCVVFIDYLQRISYNIHKEAQELQMICNKIADAAREYNISIVLLSQLANSAEREGVSIGSLKGSGGIGESADIIILLENLYRKQKTEENKNKMDVYIEQRYGDSGKIELYTDLSTCMFGDLVEQPKDWGFNNA